MKLNSILNLSRIALVAMCMIVFGFAANAQATPEAAEAATAVQNAVPEVVPAAEGADYNEAAKYFAIALIMACGSFAAALAVGKIGVAAMGAAAEKPELLGKAIAFVGLGEGIALFGFLVSLFLLNK